MTDTYEGHAGEADLRAAIIQAVNNASEDHGESFAWEMVEITGSHGLVPYEVGIKIKIVRS
ncbi:MAG: hypothetical protein AAF405_04960 [Pseudomonadota bacterium]